MRTTAAIVAMCLLASCAGHTPPSLDAEPLADIPEDLVVNRTWSSNADGYIYSVGYFTPEQLESKAWEKERMERRTMAKFCASERLVSRDVRLFEPIAVGEPSCALVVYSYACSSRRPEWGSSLEYGRKQALLDEPMRPISRNCGEKSRKNLPEPVSQTAPPDGIIISERADCRTLPDAQVGRFRLRDVNYVNARTLVSPSFVRKVSFPYPAPAQHFHHAASEEQRVHIVIVSRPLPDDGNNIFIEQTFAANERTFCATLTARQGGSMWRKSIHADLSKQGSGPAGQGEKSFNQYDIAKALQVDLANHMGIRVQDRVSKRT